MGSIKFLHFPPMSHIIDYLCFAQQVFGPSQNGDLLVYIIGQTE